MIRLIRTLQLNNVSDVNSLDQLARNFQGFRAHLISHFVDSGIHSCFGTQYFKIQLQNGYYLEVVCPLATPSSDSIPFSKAVSRRAAEGGGWFTWVVAVDDVSKIEKRINRVAVDGHRTKPDKKDLAWKQNSVLGTLEDKQPPFFIEWLSLDHPSTDVKAIAKIVKVEITGDESRIEEWFGSELREAIGPDVEVKWVAAASDGESGIVAAHVVTPSGVVRLD